MSDALVLQGLSVARGGRLVVRDASLSVPRGEITALLGPNGAGKSSLVLAVAGVVRPSTGSIRAGGLELAGRRPERVRQAGVATVPEGHRVLGDLSVADNLRVAAARLPRRARPAALARVNELFGELGELRDQHAGSLSGGEQQMLAFGRALMSRPKLMLLDEPSMGLAPMLIQQIFSIITEINQQGTTILLVEQNAQQALSRAHRAYVLETGRIVKSGTGADLLHDSAVKDAYLGVA
jgi:branched-chain amino acid transport system ATP-binding protein